MLALAALLLLIASVWVAMITRRIREERRKVALPEKLRGDSSELLSVIIPARNAEGEIGLCLSSLVSQGGVRMEIIVVDDDSEDSTADIVRRAFGELGVRCIKLRGKPPGWNGKSWACWNGYLASRGDFLLFIDADVEMLDSYVVADSLTYASEKGLDVLSLIPLLRSDSLASKTILPTLLFLMYVLASPSRSNDPGEKLAFLFGAYILIRRSAYEKVGGHRAVHDYMLEDKALGERLKSAGLRVLLLDSRRRLKASFNDSLSQYFNAMLRLFSEYARESGMGKLLKYLVSAITFFLLPVITLVYSVLTNNVLLLYASLPPLLAMVVAQGYELRKLNANPIYAPLIAASAPIIVSALAMTLASYRCGVKIRWRGRDYLYSAPNV